MINNDVWHYVLNNALIYITPAFCMVKYFLNIMEVIYWTDMICAYEIACNVQLDLNFDYGILKK